MLGTLNGALEVRGISLPPEAITAEVRGINDMWGKLPVLTRIEVHYRLRIAAGARAAADRALATHGDKCPTAASLKGAVEVSWSADIEELPE
jgi:organic hydroperoxide reductase OsmC/OhrA